MDSKSELESKKFPQFFFSVLAALSGVVIGSAVGWSSPVTRLMLKQEVANDPVSWKTVGCYCLGSALGGLLEVPLTGCFGCKWSTVTYNAVAAIGWLILAPIYSAFYREQILPIGRLVLGFGTGGLGLLTPKYISQITDPDIRGRAQVFHYTFVCFGVLYAYMFGSVFGYANLIGMCVIWPFLHMCLAFILPESPYQLYECGCDKDARLAMCRIKGTDSDYQRIQEYKETSIKFQNNPSYSKANDFPLQSVRRGQRMFIVGMGLVVFQQVCGVTSMIFRMEEVFYQLINSGHELVVKAQTLAIVLSLVQVLLCLLTVELVEYLGRKFMLILSATGMALCLLALMVFHTFFAEECSDGVDWYSNLIIAFVCLYVCCYTVGWGSVVMLMYTEIVHFDKWFSSTIYAVGQLVMCLMAYAFFHVDFAKRYDTLGVYFASSVLSIVFVVYCLPDTRGLHLNRIQQVLLQDDTSIVRSLQCNLHEITVPK